MWLEPLNTVLTGGAFIVLVGIVWKARGFIDDVGEGFRKNEQAHHTITGRIEHLEGKLKNNGALKNE